MKHNYNRTIFSENSISFLVKPNYASPTDFSVEELKPQDCHFIGPDSINISFVLLLLAISRKQIDEPRRIDFKIGFGKLKTSKLSRIDCELRLNRFKSSLANYAHYKFKTK